MKGMYGWFWQPLFNFNFSFRSTKIMTSGDLCWALQIYAEQLQNNKVGRWIYFYVYTTALTDLMTALFFICLLTFTYSCLQPFQTSLMSEDPESIKLKEWFSLLFFYFLNIFILIYKCHLYMTCLFQPSWASSKTYIASHYWLPPDLINIHLYTKVLIIESFFFWINS